MFFLLVNLEFINMSPFTHVAQYLTRYHSKDLYVFLKEACYAQQACIFDLKYIDIVN